LEPYDAPEARMGRDSATAAFDWAGANPESGSDFDNGFYTKARNIAAAELFEITGEAGYAQIFADTFVYAGEGGVEWYENQWEAAYVYANSGQAAADPSLKALALQTLQERVDWFLENGARSGFNLIKDPYQPYGWGNTASQPTNSAEILLRMHALTGDDAYLTPAQQDVDYAFGANPMNMSFVTGLDTLIPGVRQPQEILDADSDVLGQGPVPGITLYGEYNVYDYGWGFYHSEMWEDTWPNYYDAPVHESWNGLYSFVPVTEFTVMQGMEDMAFVTGYLAAMEGGGGSDPGSTRTVEDDEDRFAWASYTDMLDADGVLTSRQMIYDDGRVRDTRFEDDVRAAATMTDPEDAHGWQRVDTLFDDAGVLRVHSTLLDTGITHTSTFEDGARVARVIQDTGGTKPWLELSDRFDDTGALASRSMLFDDGRLIEFEYTSGRVSKRVATDAPGTKSWTTKTDLYDASGRKVDQVIVYDDGRIYDVDFVNGIRSRSVSTDTEDQYGWSMVVTDYDAAGTRVSRTTIYDDGREVVTAFGESLDLM